MSHFYGTIDPNNGRNNATKCGHKNTGLTTHAAGWGGAIEVNVYFDEATQQDRFEVFLTPWQNSGGERKMLATGVLDANAANQWGIGEAQS